MKKDPDILDILRHYNKLSQSIRIIENELETIRQNIPRAADEIVKLRKENKELKKQLTYTRNMAK
jgi:regulator of replication initiation timing